MARRASTSIVLYICMENSSFFFKACSVNKQTEVSDPLVSELYLLAMETQEEGETIMMVIMVDE
jgi:hypothetical protein